MSDSSAKLDGAVPLQFDTFGLSAAVRTSGLELEIAPFPGDARPTRVVRVETVSFGRIDNPGDLGAGGLSIDDARAEIARPGIVEWFRARDGGIEQLDDRRGPARLDG